MPPHRMTTQPTGKYQKIGKMSVTLHEYILWNKRFKDRH